MCDINTSTPIPQASGSIMKAARTVEEESQETLPSGYGLVFVLRNSHSCAYLHKPRLGQHSVHPAGLTRLHTQKRRGSGDTKVKGGYVAACLGEN